MFLAMQRYRTYNQVGLRVHLYELLSVQYFFSHTHTQKQNVSRLEDMLYRYTQEMTASPETPNPASARPDPKKKRTLRVVHSSAL